MQTYPDVHQSIYDSSFDALTHGFKLRSRLGKPLMAFLATALET